MATDATRGKPVRRTQAERTATMRARILKATVTCLYEHGYGATTTVSVATTAKASRGAMLHHFPSKADLMLAALSHVLDLNAANFQKAAAKIDDPWERYASLPDLRLSAASQPAGVAFLEIMVGARSDEAVRSRFAEFQQRLGGRTAQHMTRMAEDAGIRVTPRDRAISRTVALAIFGLAIQKQVLPQLDTEEVLAVLRDLKRDAMAKTGSSDELVTEAAPIP